MLIWFCLYAAISLRCCSITYCWYACLILPPPKMASCITFGIDSTFGYCFWKSGFSFRISLISLVNWFFHCASAICRSSNCCWNCWRFWSSALIRFCNCSFSNSDSASIIAVSISNPFCMASCSAFTCTVDCRIWFWKLFKNWSYGKPDCSASWDNSCLSGLFFNSSISCSFLS